MEAEGAEGAIGAQSVPNGQGEETLEVDMLLLLSLSGSTGDPLGGGSEPLAW